jgi:hypothetical protein
MLERPRSAAGSRAASETFLWTAVAIVVAAAIAWTRLDRGWVPHDEGLLGQTAERIRLGQLPHRDFEELYTGALGYWNALSQRLFGTTLMAPRYAIFGVWCGWLALVFGIVRRSTFRVAPWWAAVITVAVAMWTLPVYAAAMPSWYLLFCATTAVAALLKWIDGRDPRWLLAAGAAIGVGLTIKITALYLLAAALLSLVFAAQERVAAASIARRRWAPNVIVIAGAAALAAMVLWLLRDRTAAPELLHLAAPVVVLVLALSVREVRTVREGGRDWNDLVIPFAWLAAGVAMPVALFAVPYLLTGSLPALARGVFLDPLRRVGDMNLEMAPLTTTARGAGLVVLAAIELRWGGRRAVKAAAVCAALWFSWRSRESLALYQALWEGARLLLPATVALIAFRFAQRPPADTADARDRLAAVTLATFAALFALNQFPFSAAVYFCYVAPLAFLALVRAVPHAASRLTGTTVVLGTFAVVSLHQGDLDTLGNFPARVDLEHRLAMARGGLRVSAADSALYANVQASVVAHRDRRPVLAAPGIPEIPFLAGPPYFGRCVFCFNPRELRDTAAFARLARAESAAVVVWNLQPAFGEPVPPGVRTWYGSRFPDAVRVDDAIEVRWNSARSHPSTLSGGVR